MNTINVEEYIRFGNPRKHLSARELTALSNCELLITGADYNMKGSPHLTEILCSDINSGSQCSGKISVIITDVPNELKWSCEKCGRMGTVLNWRKSPAFRKINIQSRNKPGKRANIVFEGRELKTLKKICSTEPDLSIILENAEKSGSTYLVYMPEYDMSRLLKLISDRIETSPSEKEELTILIGSLINRFAEQESLLN